MKIIQVSVGSVRMPPKEGWAQMQVVINTSKHFVRMGHEVVILDRKYSKDDLDVDQIEGLEIVRLKALQIRLGKAPGFVRFLLAEISAALFAFKVSGYLKRNRQNIDIIHLHVTSIGLIVSMLNRGLRRKMVYTCHLGLWTLPENGLRTFERVHLFLDAFLMRRVAQVIALNVAARERFTSLSKVKAANITVVSHGVDTEFFNPNIEVEETVNKYGLESKLTILFVGRLAKIKGVSYLLKATDMVVNEFGHRDTLFMLVGPSTFDATEGPIAREEILSFTRRRQLEKYVILGGSLPLEDVRRLYVAADIFVLPSLFESGPLVTLEAMASGKPVIATKVGDTMHQIKDGWNGFLIDPGDERQLAERIVYLIANPEERQRMGANSRRYAEEEFDWSNVAEKLLRVYQS